MTPRRPFLRSLRVLPWVGAGCAVALARRAAAAEAPGGVNRLIIPFPPGGATDIFGRLLADRLSERLATRVIVDNRPGGGTVTGTLAVARARPEDGVLGIVVSSHTINAALRGDLPYDHRTDFTYITQLARAHVVLVAGPGLPAASLAEVVRLSRSLDRGLSVATPGVGTVMHMTLELLARESGAHFVHVPYAGGAPAVGDVAAGRVDLLIDAWVSARASVQAGRLKAIAAAGAAALPGADAIPRVADTYPGFSAYSMVGLVGPAGLGTGAADAIHEATRAILADRAMGQTLLGMGLEPVSSSPGEFRDFVASEVVRWRQVAADRGIRLL